MDKQDLTRYLSLYGSDSSRWPSDLQQQLQDDESLQLQFKHLSAEEAEFEQQLLLRSFEPHDADWVQRISARAELAGPYAGPSVVQRLPIKQLLRPALAMAATLTLGILLGYYLPANQQAAQETTNEDYTALLYFQDDLL